MLKEILSRSFIRCYSLFYCFCHFKVIHSLNNVPLLVSVLVSILSLPRDRYKSKDISTMTRAIKKWTTAHSSQQAHFHHINIFFLKGFFGLQKSKGTLVSWNIPSFTQVDGQNWRGHCIAIKTIGSCSFPNGVAAQVLHTSIIGNIFFVILDKLLQ